MMSPIHRRPITVVDCDLPDEYVDAVVSFDASDSRSGGTTPESLSESSPSSTEHPYPPAMSSPSAIFRSLVPQNWLEQPNDTDNINSVKQHDGRDSTSSRPANCDLKLSEYDLPDEYVDPSAIISFDDNDLTQQGEILSDKLGTTLQSSMDCLAHHHPSVGRCSNLRDDDRNDVALNDCDLPDEYVPVEVSCSTVKQQGDREGHESIRHIARRHHFENESLAPTTPPVATTTTTRMMPARNHYLSNPTDSTDMMMEEEEEEMIPSMAPSKQETLLRRRHGTHSYTTDL